MNDESLMPFGKHKGVKMANVPPEYLIWLYEQSGCLNYARYSDLKKYVEENMDVLKSEIALKNKSK